ncbi:MAG: 3-phosphoserine/phosphohydroxythreonine transaminase [Kiritimatiellia bacterium]|nr:3-phosphoserine/phosphohydroxythreonine transaminase [Lentisphaerota bacterium]
MTRAFNFNAGPATLPQEVLEEAREELLDYRQGGASVMEISHRGKLYDAVHTEAVENFSKLLGCPDDYAVLFLPGGATMQFAMLPLNLLSAGRTADYINSGSWAEKALKEAKLVGRVNVAADTSKAQPARLPVADELQLTPGAAYVHITSNETIAGTQWKEFPRSDSPLVADMSSDILSRPFDIKQFGMIYAGAQKNLGPAGISLVVMRKDLAENAPANLPQMLRYKAHLEANSLYNTPPTFSIYLMMLVSRWILKQGLENLYRRNAEKAARLYAVIDAGGFYRGTAAPEYRSDMNVTFRLPTEDLEKQFLKQAEELRLQGLKGHRSVGGVRASIYNAMPEAGVEALCGFMREFEAKNG